MWTFLTLPVYARTSALLHICRCAQTAIAPNREDRDVAAGVIRYQNKFAAGIDIHVTGVGAQRWLLIQQPQGARFLIDSKGADGATFLTRKLLDFIDRVQILPVACETKKGRIDYAT